MRLPDELLEEVLRHFEEQVERSSEWLPFLLASKRLYFAVLPRLYKSISGTQLLSEAFGLVCEKPKHAAMVQKAEWTITVDSIGHSNSTARKLCYSPSTHDALMYQSLFRLSHLVNLYCLSVNLGPTTPSDAEPPIDQIDSEGYLRSSPYSREFGHTMRQPVYSLPNLTEITLDLSIGETYDYRSREDDEEDEDRAFLRTIAKHSLQCLPWFLTYGTVKSIQFDNIDFFLLPEWDQQHCTGINRLAITRISHDSDRDRLIGSLFQACDDLEHLLLNFEPNSANFGDLAYDIWNGQPAPRLTHLDLAGINMYEYDISFNTLCPNISSLRFTNNCKTTLFQDVCFLFSSSKPYLSLRQVRLSSASAYPQLSNDTNPLSRSLRSFADIARFPVLERCLLASPFGQSGDWQHIGTGTEESWVKKASGVVVDDFQLVSGGNGVKMSYDTWPGSPAGSVKRLYCEGSGEVEVEWWPEVQ